MKLDDLSYVVIASVGFAALVAPARVLAIRQKRHDHRVADRLARGHDAYFEELRQLNAYRPTNNLWKTRLGGAAVLTLGCYFLANDYFLN